MKTIHEMWFQDYIENKKEIEEQTKIENITLILRLMPIDIYEEGKKNIKYYNTILKYFFKQGEKK